METGQLPTTLEEARAFFKDDGFATIRLGAVIDMVEPEHARVSVEVTPEHRNARGELMGGASYALADFAFAVETYTSGHPAVSLSANIEYISIFRGTRLIADCTTDRAGRTIVFCTTVITDDTGRLVAKVSTSGFRVES